MHTPFNLILYEALSPRLDVMFDVVHPQRLHGG